ncbi:hypothetical protein [Streptomyces sp. NPDC020965]|uniref:hypothetical protein n=1 Tax=Streptomyces sp. NPDC020965 TaxID=3365105 RepID=UPI0037A06626
MSRTLTGAPSTRRRRPFGHTVRRAATTAAAAGLLLSLAATTVNANAAATDSPTTAMTAGSAAAPTAVDLWTPRGNAQAVFNAATNKIGIWKARAGNATLRWSYDGQHFTSTHTGAVRTWRSVSIPNGKYISWNICAGDGCSPTVGTRS